jgi:hypothetical protein
MVSASPILALAADRTSLPEEGNLHESLLTQERTYFQEHRLRAYERTRADTKQGATCVTPAGVCWIIEPLSRGTSCSCLSQRLGVTTGAVGG